MKPITRTETFLAAAGGQNVDLPVPVTREEVFLNEIAQNGGSGGSSAPADWNAAEGEPGHVLNRTHYEEDAFEPIYWDGSTEGRDTIDATAFGYGVFYKISDHAITQEELAKMRVEQDEARYCGVYQIYNETKYPIEMRYDDGDGGRVYAEGWLSEGDIYYQTYVMSLFGFSFIELVLAYVYSVENEFGLPIQSVGTYASLVITEGTTLSDSVFFIDPPKITHKLDPKYLPEGIGYSAYETGTVLEETSPAFDEEQGQFNLTDPIRVTTGEEYTVKWNGTEYTCVCGEVELDSMICQYLGNTSVMEGDDTGEPFFMLVLPSEVAAAMGFTAQIMPLDGSTELTISITGTVETVTPIPAKYLPGAFIVYVGSDKCLYKTPDTSDPANLLIKEELASLVKSGTAIYRCYTAEDGALGYFLSTEIAIGAEGGSIIYNTSYGKDTCFVPNTRDV